MDLGRGCWAESGGKAGDQAGVVSWGGTGQRTSREAWKIPEIWAVAGTRGILTAI